MREAAYGGSLQGDLSGGVIGVWRSELEIGRKSPKVPPIRRMASQRAAFITWRVSSAWGRARAAATPPARPSPTAPRRASLRRAVDAWLRRAAAASRLRARMHWCDAYFRTAAPLKRLLAWKAWWKVRIARRRAALAMLVSVRRRSLARAMWAMAAYAWTVPTIHGTLVRWQRRSLTRALRVLGDFARLRRAIYGWLKRGRQRSRARALSWWASAAWHARWRRTMRSLETEAAAREIPRIALRRSLDTWKRRSACLRLVSALSPAQRPRSRTAHRRFYRPALARWQDSLRHQSPESHDRRPVRSVPAAVPATADAAGCDALACTTPPARGADELPTPTSRTLSEAEIALEEDLGYISHREIALEEELGLISLREMVLEEELNALRSKRAAVHEVQRFFGQTMAAAPGPAA